MINFLSNYDNQWLALHSVLVLVSSLLDLHLRLAGDAGAATERGHGIASSASLKQCQHVTIGFYVFESFLLLF